MAEVRCSQFLMRQLSLGVLASLSSLKQNGIRGEPLYSLKVASKNAFQLYTGSKLDPSELIRITLSRSSQTNEPPSITFTLIIQRNISLRGSLLAASVLKGFSVRSPKLTVSASERLASLIGFVKPKGNYRPIYKLEGADKDSPILRRFSRRTDCSLSLLLIVYVRQLPSA